MSFWRTPAYVRDLQVFEETVTLAQFTDGGAAIGTYVCTFDLPAGFWLDRAILTDVIGFSGDTSATIQVGDGTDVDRLNTGTPSVFANATIIDLGAPSGVLPVTTAYKPKLTVTAATDWGAVAAGKLTLQVWGYVVR
jgi:hypothetical protein